MSLKTAIRPPQKPIPPKMVVETVQFNPSVWPCGEYGCQSQYRMEKRVLWTNKDEYNAKQQLKVNDREKKNEYRESKFEDRITKQDKKKDTESEQMGLKEENDLDIRFLIESDGNKCGSAESFKERMSGRSGYIINSAVTEKEVEVEGDDYNDDVKKEKEEEVSNTNNIKVNNSNGRSDRDNSEGRHSKEEYEERSIGNDSESAFNNDQTIRVGDGAVDRDDAYDDWEYCSENRILINNSDKTVKSCSLKDKGLEDVLIASAFGIMYIYCNSELHSWSFEGEDA